MSNSNRKRKSDKEAENVSQAHVGDASQALAVKKEKSLKMGLPARWLYCPPIGKVVAEKFLPMKTPLADLYDSLVEPSYRFHPQDVFKRPLINAKKDAKIGLWMDFTKTSRYYDRQQVEKNCCIYKKMPMEGHGQTPTEEETREFIECVNAFFENNPSDIVALHCTHGFNRTGFLIVAYLVDQCSYAVDMAIEEFASARPNGIYKEDYLKELCKRYGDEEDVIQPPGRPLWEEGPIAEDEYCNGAPIHFVEGIHPSSLPSTSHANPSTLTSTKQNGTVKRFMDGLVPGVTYVEDEEERVYLQGKTREYCNYKGKGFPGSQPVSLEHSPQKDNLRFLAEQPYMVSWKADGVRYLVLVEGDNQVYAFDRDNNVFKIPNVTFLHRKLGRHLRNTLVDAEMIIDKVQENGKVVDTPRLLIYDIIRFEDQDVGKENFQKRFNIIDIELIKPRREAMQKGKIRREKEPMSIRRKDFFLLIATPKFFDQKFLKNIGHEIDGLIFQPVNLPYHPGRCDMLLKWKPPGLCTIDFKLDIRKVQKQGELPEWVGNLHVLHTELPFGRMKVTKDLKQYDQKIVECKLNPATQLWEFLRERTDKSFPNALTTAMSVCSTIRYPVSKDALLNFIIQKGCKINESG